MRVQQNRQPAERGVAMVIALFTLMLISVVATALILMAGTETALKGNYKSAMQSFYDAKAGLEEGRGRLFWPNPNIPNLVATCVFPAPGAMMPANRVCYILNPSPGEVVNPQDLSAANPYADNEYLTEWNTTAIPSGASYNTVISNSPIASANIAGPLYKWVRITPRTEASANFDSDADGLIDNTPLFFDGQNVFDSKNGVPPGAAQVLTITSLAVTPYGSRRMVQYTAASESLAAAMPTFPSALTLDGNGVRFTGPGGNGNFQIVGNDINAPSGSPSGVPAIGYTNSNDYSNPSSGLSTAAASSNYQSPAGIPNVDSVSLPPLLQTPGGLLKLVQSITQSADLVLNPAPGTSADQTSLTSMSAFNPMVVVVNGDFHLTHGGGGAFTGYGLLVVTGTLRYDPDDSWDGVILVIGRGVFDGSQGGRGGQINGTVLVANTTDSSGRLLTNLGPASYNQAGGGNGIQYSSNWVKTVQGLMPYQVLSFREISQTTP